MGGCIGGMVSALMKIFFNTVKDKKDNVDKATENWKCPLCGKENSKFFKRCECGYESNNSNEK